MTTLATEMIVPSAVSVEVTKDTLMVKLNDGYTISAPIAGYPRLLNGNRKERANWRLIGQGHGIHWEDLDEDISVDNLMMGRPSNESRASLERWLDSRKASLLVYA
uniref:DUF2442 domain-containing protein n=2 Tax=unclassified Candidatus Kentrum TaxID=2643149 RepID=A0A451B1P8_9GAMM|nr:MAG: Protein of unknown function (DUF2442) [Candidatus Kentron sp. LPFa]VFK66736.1 MAG: Protein of unknown function (DUF2442) [Candidatus Kentron sp. UNK]VFK72209.1 MAG: Protein of unknown function (DUF2442) [Candidatus Kentron sp. UNK]